MRDKLIEIIRLTIDNLNKSYSEIYIGKFTVDINSMEVSDGVNVYKLDDIPEDDLIYMIRFLILSQF